MIFNENEDYLEIKAKFRDSTPVPKYLKYIDFIVKDKNPILILEFKNLSTYIFGGAKIYPLQKSQISNYGFQLQGPSGSSRTFAVGQAKASISEILPSETTSIELDLKYLNSESIQISFRIYGIDNRVIHTFSEGDNVNEEPRFGNFWGEDYIILTESDFREKKSKRLAQRGLIASLIMTSLILINQLTDGGLPEVIRAAGRYFNYLFLK